ncbi:MAG: SMC family ATPase [Thaumarchaeota archaeon]|nr:MAG: SMC family ATPase [Nitrososphaerota archaeon]
MLNEIELANFLSHSSTKLGFNKGVTVFVGQNGAGKSSIIDGITFALFGQHTRNSNKGLVRRGANQAYSKVNFSISDRRFEAIRKIDSKGTVSAQFFEKKDGTLLPLAAGERKQFGESMTKTIESLIGMDFDKLKVASIVQQGELNSIINADPKKFKELVNAIIGIDKLDTAFEIMKEVVENFRSSIREKLEYDDMDIESLKIKIDVATREIKQAEPQKKEMLSRKKAQENELAQLQKKIDTESVKELKIKELETRKSELVQYVKTAISALKKEIQEKEKKFSDCDGCFICISSKKETESQITKIENEFESSRKKIQEFLEKLGKLGGQEELAGKLKLQDGKCPVCNSKVESLNPLFEEEHIHNEIVKIRNRLDSLTKLEKDNREKKLDLEQKLQKALNAERTLSVHGIRQPQELAQLKEEISMLKNNIQGIPSELNSSENLVHLAIDPHSESLCKTIKTIQEETMEFDLTDFQNLKISFDQKRKSLSMIEQEIGAVTQKIRTAKEQQEKISQTIEDLVLVKKYVSQLEEIRGQIFNRDGPVATSLRSWALNLISQKASEYLSTFNVKIQRVLLQEKARDVGISCYSGSTILELDSLSGGEKVSVALALRLGMAHILGSSNLNFIILDEPTTHLDEERRKSLVGILSHAFEANLGAISQFIIITHDSEIFENSNVDTIYNFEATAEGTKVTPF